MGAAVHIHSFVNISAGSLVHRGFGTHGGAPARPRPGQPGHFHRIRKVGGATFAVGSYYGHSKRLANCSKWTVIAHNQ